MYHGLNPIRTIHIGDTHNNNCGEKCNNNQYINIIVKIDQQKFSISIL